MNKPIRTMAVFCMLLILALMLNATYLQFYKARALDDDPLNRRVIEAAFARERGAILVGNRPIADSVPSSDKYAYQRTYDSAEEYSHITGYFSYFSQTGIEQTQNSVLSGDDSRLFLTRWLDILSNAEPKGGSVQLTLNRKVQDAAYQGLKALGSGTEAAAVAIEPSTGKILGMVSTPDFDPNKLASHDLGAVSKTYNALNAEPSQPLLNRAIQTTLPPGSTFKLVTAAAAIEDLGYTPDTMVPGGSSLDLPQTSNVIKNENGTSCGGGKITLTRALEVSCNVAFGSVGLALSNDQLRTQAEKFGFDQHYFDDLTPQAVSRFPATLDDPLRAYSAIGQYEVAATPLQMAMVAAGIANGGTVMKPYLVDQVRSPTLETLSRTEPSQLSQAVSARTADALTKMMVGVVDDGTGVNAQIPGVAVAGKTGTAQSTPSRPPYAWFVSFAPAAAPKIAVAVLVQSSDTDRTEIAGGRLCAPIAKAMMEAVVNP